MRIDQFAEERLVFYPYLCYSSVIKTNGSVEMEAMEELRRKCESCTACVLCETRTKLVFGTGDPNARLMLIGEGPGEQEDLSGIPFVGRAGKLLDDLLELADVSREEVYIANIVKCRPPKNRDPFPEERDACYHWLEEQIRLIQPKLIVCLGRIAAMRFIRPDYKISAEHGQWIDRDGIAVTAIFHPAALLRDPRRRPEAYEDMKEIARRLRALSD